MAVPRAVQLVGGVLLAAQLASAVLYTADVAPEKADMPILASSSSSVASSSSSGSSSAAAAAAAGS